MSEHYGAIAPDMPAKQGRAEAFDECYAIAADAVQQHQPQLIVGCPSAVQSLCGFFVKRFGLAQAFFWQCWRFVWFGRPSTRGRTCHFDSQSSG